MSGETVVNISGNLTADPELRFTPSGAAVANFTVASKAAAVQRPDQMGRRRRPVHAVAFGWRA